MKKLLICLIRGKEISPFSKSIEEQSRRHAYPARIELLILHWGSFSECNSEFINHPI